jgi:hypothetical protein
MVPIRLAALLLATVLCGAAADPAAWFEAKTEDMAVKARLVRDQKEIRGLLENDLNGEYVLVELEIRPSPGAKFTLDRDDFLMRSYRNNDTSEAQSPDRIAGGSVLVLGGRTASSGVISETGGGIPVGGLPGTGTRPRRIGDDTVGITSGNSSERTVEAAQGAKRNAQSLMERLQARELPVGPVDETVRGFLYFQMNPKDNPKNLTLNYDGPPGKFRIHFKPE